MIGWNKPLNQLNHMTPHKLKKFCNFQTQFTRFGAYFLPTLYWKSINLLKIIVCFYPGGTDLERGYGDVWPWRPPFHASLVVPKGPISSKSVSSQNPLLRTFWDFSLYSLNFCPNLSSQAPKFGNFQFTSPKIWKFSAHKPPISEAKISSQAPRFGNPGRIPLPEKKVECPPRLLSYPRTAPDARTMEERKVLLKVLGL